MRIHSFIPNPIGKDTDGEIIVLENTETAPISLKGWELRDASGKQFVIGERMLAPKEKISFSYAVTRITLNNGGETVSLSDPQGVLRDELGYTGNAVEGRVITHEIVLDAAAKELLFDPLALQPITLQHKEISWGGMISLMVVVGALLALGATFLVERYGKE